MKNIIGISTTKIFLPNFSGVIDTAENRMTPLKPKNDFESPYLILNRTSSKNIS
jgi:hypothetical protein